MEETSHDEKHEEVTLERIFESLRELHRKVDKLMATQADLDAALATVDGDVSQVTDAVDTIVAALQAADVPVDLSSEVAMLQNFHAALQGDVTDIDTAESQATPALSASF